ncbi:RNA-directed DNA polymerase, eukaryota [Tanacetum coccineum]
MLAILTCIQLQEGNDKLCWSLDGETEFSVAGTRRRIDAFLHTGSNIGSIWCNSVPKKVNVFAWRVLLDRLPTRYNLSRIGLEVESILCPTCGAGMESMSHTLFTCCLAKEVWTHIYGWCNLSMFNGESFFEWWEWCDLLPIRNNRRSKMQFSTVRVANPVLVHNWANI